MVRSTLKNEANLVEVFLGSAKMPIWNAASLYSLMIRLSIIIHKFFIPQAAHILSTDLVFCEQG